MKHRMPLFCSIGLVTAILVPGTSARAQNWLPVGPAGGDVRALAPDPQDTQRLFLGTADGILYRSDDSGMGWHRLDPGFPLRGCSLDEVVVDRRGVVFVGYLEVGGSGGGVARSADGGQTFTILEDMAGESVRALALAPSDSRFLAAGTLTGVFLSADSGTTWRRITPKNHTGLRNIDALVFDPANPRILYAGTWHLGWKTSNGGATWVTTHRGMIDDSHVMTLTLDHSTSRTLYATACTGIYRSTDGAMVWNKLPGIPFSSRRTRSFAQDVDDANLLLAGTTEGLWLSNDRGDSWRRVTPGNLVVNALLVQADGSIVLGTEGAGVLRSADRGRSWSACNTGFSEQRVQEVLFSTEGHRLLVRVWGNSPDGGIFVSPGVRGPWTHLGNGLEDRQVLSLAFLSDTTLAGTDDGIFARAATDTVWTRMPTCIDGSEVHPRVSKILALSSYWLLAATSKELIRSTDGGRNWTPTTLGMDDEVRALAASPLDPGLILATTRSGVFRSHDGGDTWARVSSGPKDVTSHALVFMPSDDHVLFLTTSGGLFRSGDQGATWQRVNGGLPHSDLTGLVIHPDSRTIYASDFDRGGIFRSVDGGATWERMPTDGLGSDRVWALALDPGAPEDLLAASWAGGLHLLVPPTAGEPAASD